MGANRSDIEKTSLPIPPLKHRPFKQLLIEMKAVGERDWTESIGSNPR
jgi:hypothetical protein